MFDDVMGIIALVEVCLAHGCPVQFFTACSKLVELSYFILLSSEELANIYYLQKLFRRIEKTIFL